MRPSIAFKSVVNTKEAQSITYAGGAWPDSAPFLPLKVNTGGRSVETGEFLISFGDNVRPHEEPLLDYMYVKKDSRQFRFQRFIDKINFVFPSPSPTNFKDKKIIRRTKYTLIFLFLEFILSFCLPLLTSSPILFY